MDRGVPRRKVFLINFIFTFSFYIGVQSTNNALIPGVQQGDSVLLMHVSILFSNSSPIQVRTCQFGLPRWLSGKEFTYSAGDGGLISGLGRSPGEGHGNPLRYSCLGNSMNRRPWDATVHGVAKELDTTQQLNTNMSI